MTKQFEDYFTEFQTNMVAICLEYVKHRADNIYIYIYCSYEPKMYSFNVFFGINGNIVHKHQLNEAIKDVEENFYDVSEKKQDGVLDIGITNLQRIHELCKKFNRDMPTEMKICYDVKNNSLKAAYRYDLVYSNDELLHPNDIFNEWFEEVKKEMEK